MRKRFLGTIGEQETVEKRAKMRWNFMMGLLHGVFFTGGMAFSNSTVILPVFLNSLTSSKSVIGFFSSIMRSGSFLPQLFVASRIRTRESKKPVLIFAIVVRMLCWGALGILTYFYGADNPTGVLFSLFFLLTLFSFMGGVAVIPFMDIFGGTIPSNLRGRFFGHRQLWGGLLAVGAGFVVRYILGSQNIPFPKNYSLLFLLSFVFIGISYIALGSVKEPVYKASVQDMSFVYFLREAFGILKSNKNYLRFVIIRILAGGGGVALPFYVLYAKDTLNVDLGIVGIFISAQMLGGIFSNILWARLSDFMGNRRVIQVCVFLRVLIPITALLIPGELSHIYILVFILIGFVTSAEVIGPTNFLLDMAPDDMRPTYVSLTGTLTAPIMFFPLIGGLLLQHISYRSVFILAAVSVAGGLVLSHFLEEPRDKEYRFKHI
jgi:MFS family permease